MKNLKKKLFACSLAIAMLTAFMSGCGENNSDNGDSSPQNTSASTVTTSSSEQDTTESTETSTAETTKAAHISPTENITSSVGAEVTDINEVMDYDSNKTYKRSLSDFTESDDEIESFVFIFTADNGTSNIGTYKGACGISVSEDCPDATDDCWYQSDDFSVSFNSSYAEVEWKVPDNIKDYIKSGEKDAYIEIGYWWSDTQRLKLTSIVCNYKKTREIPVDNTVTQDVNTSLNYETDASKMSRFDLSDFISDGDIPQAFIFKAEAGSSLGKFTCGLGITVSDDCSAATDDNWYQTDNFVKFTDGNSVEIVWIIPDEVKEYVKADGELMFGYWWSDCKDITLKSVTAKYSNDGESDTENNTDSNTNSNEKETVKDNSSEPASDDMNITITSAEIVKDMKIGWNLGNSLETYDVSGNSETAWGNPKTTKTMIDKIKEAGFNTVRVPVSWTDHIDENYSIDAEWLSRVQEVVDYVIDNDMYCILNVHHDDYTWLNPTYDDRQKVEGELTAIWEQICSQFIEYDEHLLFEGMNEPRVIGGTDEWTKGTAEERDVINQLFESFVETVRSSGGNNTYRHLIITSHAASIDSEAVKAVEIPNDERIIVSIHYYSPWDFVGNESDVSNWGTDSEKQALDKGFDLLKSTFIDKGTPVIIGEFGTVDKDNTQTRADYMEYYIHSAKERGITCIVWDNGGDFGLFNRDKLSWDFPEILEGIMNGLN